MLFLCRQTLLTFLAAAFLTDSGTTVALEQAVQPPKKASPAAVPAARGQAGRKTAATDHHRQWLDRDVAYIISADEKAAFLKLTAAEEKDKFIELFWLRRDPDPSTSANEFKEEHYRRLAYANKHFGSGIPGWKTDRGKIYILHGEPTQIESHSGGSYQRPRNEGGGTTSTFPFEVWVYRHIEGIGDDIRIEFVDKTMTGKYTIAVDASEKDALLRIPGLGKTLLEEAGVTSKTDRVVGVNQQQSVLQLGKGLKDMPFERLIQNSDLERPRPIRFKELQQLVTAKVTYNAIPLQVTWDYFWIDDQRALVPLTINLPADALGYRLEPGGTERQATLQLYGRVSDLNGRIVREFDQESTFRPSAAAGFFLLQRQILLAPGRYRLEVMLKDAVTEKFGTSLVGLTIPSGTAGQPKISSLLLARKIEILKEPPAALEPFIYGDLRIIPEAQAEFKQDSQAGVYFQVTGASLVEQPPTAIELTYRILRKGEAVDEVRDAEGLTIHRLTQGRLVAYAFLSLRKLDPGLYTVVVICRLPGGDAVSASREIRVY